MIDRKTERWLFRAKIARRDMTIRYLKNELQEALKSKGKMMKLEYWRDLKGEIHCFDSESPFSKARGLNDSVGWTLIKTEEIICKR
jgi:hypothetical protein